MKCLKNNWKILLSLILIIFLGVYVCMFGIKNVLNNEIFTKPTVETKIYTIWHIETFEGGGKSRILYLKNIAKQIENNNDGILFNIKQIKPDKLEAELQNSKPDIFSFGFGLGKLILPYLKAQSYTYSVRDELIESGSYCGKLYAIPYMASAYAFISHNSENTETIYGNNLYTNANNFNILASASQSQYEAYKKFVNNKNINLIGTARDVFRVTNLNNIGRTNATITALSGHTDLIQYIGSSCNDKIVELFISNLLNNENQASLTDYSLFSCLHTKIYLNGIYNDMENAIISASIPNVFYE